MRYSPDRYENDLPSTNWDEYGGRGFGADKRQILYIPEDATTEDEQKATMARQAKDRAVAKRAEEGSRQNEQRERAAQKLRELDQKTAYETKARTLFDPNKPPTKESALDATLPNGSNGIHMPEVESFSRQPIQLSSFDDRDRGERGGSAAPRMLYDPKSGSMVAVPSREDVSGGGRGRKERVRKGKNILEKEPKPDGKQDTDGKRKGKREKKVGNEVGPQLKSEPKKGKGSADRKFPRTCGVLYSRDDKGNFVSVDGCDGDLGYGSHSVPGGRFRNTDAYEKFLKQQNNSRNEASMYHDGILDVSLDTEGNYGEQDVMLHTGYNIPDGHEPTFEWVTPSDKIELMTGIDGSPTLQATAKEWAPSQAALSAPPARFGHAVDRSASFDETEDDVEDYGPVSIPVVSCLCGDMSTKLYADT